MLVVSIKLLEERVRNKRQAFGCGHSAKRRSESQAVSIEIGIEWVSPSIPSRIEGTGILRPETALFDSTNIPQDTKTPLDFL